MLILISHRFQEVFGLSNEKLGSAEENEVSGRLGKVLDHVGKTMVDNFFLSGERWNKLD